MDTSGAAVEYAYLGGLTVLRDGETLHLGGHLQRTLLALLLTERGRVVSVDRIVDELWGDSPPDDPTTSIQSYVSRLRKILDRDATGSVLARVPPGYRLNVPAEAVDAERFADLGVRARQELEAGRFAAADELASSALALWRDDTVLPEFGDHSFAGPVRTRLADVRFGCEEDRAAALIALGRSDDAVARLTPLTRAEPLRERPWLLLMTALHAAGRTADALARFHDLRTLLDAELGLVPGPALRDLHVRILREGSETVAAVPPPPRPADETVVRVSAPAPTAALAAGEVPLVGRARERDLLLSFVDDLPHAGPRFVLVEGEAGIGKTRLLRDVTAQLPQRGGIAVWGRCHEDGDAPALWPWRQALRALDAAGDGDLPEDGGFAAFEYVKRRLITAAQDRPIVVVLDDIHWSDAASVRLLDFLATEASSAALGVIVTARDDERRETLQRVAGALARTPGFLRLQLARLNEDDTTTLVRAIHATDDRLAARIYARAGGNPFYTGELARFLADPYGGETDAQTHAALPASIRDVVARRLSRLPEAATKTLKLAAVLGERFDLVVLMAASSVDQDEVVDGLNAALSAGVLRPADGELSFTHALIRDTLLAEMTDLQRRRAHASVAAAMQSRADAVERAYHLVHGRPFTDAAESFHAANAAGDHAVHQLSYEDGMVWYGHALTLLDADPGLDADRSRRSALQLRLGRAASLSGRSPTAQQHLIAAIDTALGRGDTTTAAEAAAALGGTGGIWFWAKYGEYPADLMFRLEEVLAQVSEADAASRARILAAMAASGYYRPDAHVLDELTNEALALTEGLDDPEVRLETVAARLYVTWHEDRIAEQLTLIDQLLALAVTPGTEGFATHAHLRLAAVHHVLGDLDAAEEDQRRAEAIAKDARLSLYQAQLVRLRAAQATATGAFDRAESLIEEGSIIMQRLQTNELDDIDLVLLSFLRHTQGRLPELAAVGRGVLADPLVMAAERVQAGDLEGAWKVMRDTNGFTEPSRWWDWLARVCLQADIAADLGAVDVAEDLVRRLTPYANLMGMFGTLANWGPVARYLGRVEALTGRLDDAERHLRQSLALSTRNRMRPYLALSSYHLGTLLREQGQVEEAMDHLDRARSIAAELGLRHTYFER